MFDHQEYQQRIARLQQRIQQENLDAIVVGSDPNITYLIGVHCYSEERKILLSGTPPQANPH